jgi:serine protease AprX
VVLRSRTVAWLGLVGLLAPVVGSVLAAPAALAAALPVHPAVVDPGLAGITGPTKVIVQANPGRADAAAGAAKAAGVPVGERIPLIEGFSATVDPAGLQALSASGDVRAITADRIGHFTSVDESTDAGLNGETGDTATTPNGSPFTEITHANKAWARGITGQGIGVAVLDTGISEMNDLKGRIVQGPDLSGEMRTIDTFGHGTVMAGIIAGDGTDAGGLGSGRAGIAPKAHVVAVKVAGQNGAVDVSTVLQGLHWISAYRSQFNIKVLNLSYGTRSTQSPASDPLNYAVQRLWKQGITVVVAAGNDGPNASTILKPGDDPLVITVGAYDDLGDTKARNDVVPQWASRGPTAQGLTKPDIVAPGRTLIATRSYGSTVEAGNPGSLVAPSYIKGSGSSQATAVTSGLAALILQAHPRWTPDQVKRALVSTADPIRDAAWAKRVDAKEAVKASPSSTPVTSNANGLGSIEASRGGYNIVTDCGNDGSLDVIQGEIDARCEAWNGSAWTGSAWTGSAWTGSAWTGSAWTGSAWTGSAWTGSAWTGSAWTGGNWTGSAWTGSAWTGSAWTGSAWTGSAWTGSAWTGSAWTGSAWTESAWNGSAWTGSAWTGSAWTGSAWTGSAWTGSAWTTFWGPGDS